LSHTTNITKDSPGVYSALVIFISSTIKIYLVVNISRIYKYIEQVEEQKKEQLAPVIIEKEKE